MAYWLIQEGRTPEGRAEVDEMLSGSRTRERNRERAALVASLGGDVRGTRR